MCVSATGVLNKKPKFGLKIKCVRDDWWWWTTKFLSDYWSFHEGIKYLTDFYTLQNATWKTQENLTYINSDIIKTIALIYWFFPYYFSYLYSYLTDWIKVPYGNTELNNHLLKAFWIKNSATTFFFHSYILAKVLSHLVGHIILFFPLCCGSFFHFFLKVLDSFK